MSHEIGQLDIPDRELRMTSAQPRVSFSREIGEAVITHTIFGKAKVRIIRKHDKLHRVLWLTALVALAVIAWQVWLALQPVPSAVPLPAESAQTQPSTVQAESILPPSAPLAASSKPNVPIQTEIIKPVILQQSAPQAAPVLKGTGPMPAKPVTTQTKPVAPLGARVPQPAPPTANSALKNPADMPLAPKPLSPLQPAAPAVAKPRAAQPAVPPAASSPVVAAPVVKEVAPARAPAADKQPAEPVNMQSR